MKISFENFIIEALDREIKIMVDDKKQEPPVGTCKECVEWINERYLERPGHGICSGICIDYYFSMDGNGRRIEDFRQTITARDFGCIHFNRKK